MDAFNEEGQEHISLDPPIPIPEEFQTFDRGLFIALPNVFQEDVGTSPFSLRIRKTWGTRIPKLADLVIEEEIPPRAEEEPRAERQEAGPSQGTRKRKQADPTPLRRKESSEGSRAVRIPKPRQAKSKRVEEEPSGVIREAKKKKLTARKSVSFETVEVEPSRTESRVERPTVQVETATEHITIPAGGQEHSAVDIHQSPPPEAPTTSTTQAVSMPSSLPTQTSTIPTVTDPGTLALQLIKTMMESQQREKEEKEKRKAEKEKLRREEIRRQEERERRRDEEMRKEREARMKFEQDVNQTLSQTSNVLVALLDRLAAPPAVTAVPITGPVSQSQAALPSRPGEGTSSRQTGTTDSDTPKDPNPSQSQEAEGSHKDGDGAGKDKPAD